MASDPPEEALHFRGKTLTPESPRPLHIAEPSNIPLLQNQMDASYHDTSALETIPEVKEHTLNPVLVEQGLQRPAVGDQMQMVDQTYAMLQSGLEQMNASAAGRIAGITGSLPGSNAKTEGMLSENESILASTTRDEVLTNSLSSSVPHPNPTAELDLQHHQTHPDTAAHTHMAGTVENNNITAAHLAPPYLATQGVAPVYGAYQHQQQPPPVQSSPVAGYPLAPVQNPGDVNSGISQSSLLNTAAAYQNMLSSSVPSSASFITTAATTASAAAAASTTAMPTSAAHATEPISQPDHTLSDIAVSSMPISYSSTHPSRQLAATHESEPMQTSHPDTGPNTSPSKEAFQSDKSNGLLQRSAAMDASASLSTSLSSPEVLHQVPPKPHTRKVSNTSRKCDSYDENIESTKGDPQEDTPWGPDIQKKYDDFLRDERIYVTEAHWDRFPAGSRLFIGNLPTERVTKRDLFHIFHMHGKLAQISIKQAYGFIQFLEPDSCRKALQAQQGSTIRGRKIHLEISKPQRGARNSGPTENSGRKQRRSRSPEYERNREPPPRGGRSAADRYDRGPGRLAISDFREKDPHRYRDRSSRSPSPRGPRRDSYHSRERSFDRYDPRERRRSRSRSPRPRNARYRSPSPRDKGYDSESDLPIPRRDPRNVPEVQVIVLENADNEFVYRVENAFRDRGLRCDVLILSPRIRLSAVVRRQVMEGVLAIVRISRANQYSGKIPLQIFDRSGGMDNVRFNEYSELDPSLAAEVVVHARTSQKPNPTQLQPPLLPAVLPPQPIPQPVPAQSDQATIANLLSKLDSSTLHTLLGSLNQQQQLQAQQQNRQFHSQPVPVTAPPLNSTNLAALLGNLTRPGNANPPSIPTTTAPGTHFAPPPPPPPNPIPHPNTNLASLLPKGPNPGQNGPLPQPQANMQVQQIMEQLMKWKQ
ncbi:putative RNA-binding protein (Nab3) [Trichophyton interdigitale]|uniref:RNA-binding protein (Nab3) n=1 Tax=Trichophyton interdigitale TaxID=101480 RepID=A0A9P4YGT5_9EURO|nr:putative RNA-binding protein (Nab3) [Trichophyton interdigitale]KAF3894519.1 putative RNA-binding protein (Nab3) [Trichophyton interdigitale]KAG8208497.1 putative RNA-binding protein (Nab3) [Trichophyton interdigitale]